MTPEQIIQTAWVERAKREIAAKRAAGLAAREITFPVWGPEEAVRALRAAGWTPPACGCTPEAGPDLEEKLCGKAQPLSSREWALVEAAEVSLKSVDEADSALDQAMRDAADDGEWPEVGA